MISGNEAALWNQFNLAENNPDQGGILYAVRYDTETLLNHRDAVVEALVDSGAGITELSPGSIGIVMNGVKDADRQRTALLLEELSVVGEAIEYHDVGLDDDSIADLSEHLRDLLVKHIVVGSPSQAFEFANVQVSRIARDIESAHEQNQVLSAEEHQTMEDLGRFAAIKARQILGGRIIPLDEL
jgi:hypothetical protein